MSSSALMIASSIFMGLIGAALSFMPGEVLETLGQTPNPVIILTMQLTGTLYFGFATTNWVAKNITIGGIYARALCIGNFAHFFIAGLALIKTSFNPLVTDTYIWALTTFYVLFAVSFVYLLFTHP